MTTQHQRPEPSLGRRRVEMAVFVAASIVGVYAFGNAFHDLSASAVAVSLGWFALAGVAVLVLVGQMSRVHDAWPRREPSGTIRRRHLPALSRRVKVGVRR